MFSELNNNIRTNKIPLVYFPNKLNQIPDLVTVFVYIPRSFKILSAQFWFDFVKSFKSTVVTSLLLWIILVPEIKPAIPLPGPPPKPEPGKEAYPQGQQNMPSCFA